ncbi:MATE family efflux transporter [Suttonella ornithocola]|uniref:Multidrug-efflux transporter n=1 Tax=Suttonella ornithocola TaxID=279832 RepID=A0A380MPS4_9GAMM|nr:MATE family efflux transporter [Suttonella ornithocola]SUO93893.1 Na(+)/drug antiporter [Suttonella ornithocola]
MLVEIRQEIRPTLQLALPMILTQLLGYGQQIIDIVMAGRHSTLTLAGVSLAGQLFVLIYLVMVGIGIGFSAQFSRHQGGDNRSDIRHDFQQGIWLFIVLGIVTTIATLLAAYLPYLFGSQPDIADESRQYLLTLAFPAGIFVFAGLARYFLEGMASPRHNNLVIAALLPINILGNYLFLTYTNLGTQGMALATGICYLLYGAGLFYLIYKDKRWRGYRLFHKLQPAKFDSLVRLFLMGLPIGLTILMEAGTFSFIGIMASRESAVITGANQIAVNYIGIMFMVPLGIASALTIRCANALGRNDWHAIAIRASTGIGLSAVFMLVSSIVIFIARRQIADIYTNDTAIILAASQLLLVVAFLEVVDGVQIAASGVLRGLADTRVALAYAVIGYWVIGVPIGCILAYPMGMGIMGLWIGCVIGLTLFALLALYRVTIQIRHHIGKVHG